MFIGQIYVVYNVLVDVKSLQKLIELRLFDYILNSDYYLIMYYVCMVLYVYFDGLKIICKLVFEKFLRSGVFF